MIVLELMLRGLTPVQLSDDPQVRAIANDEAATLNRRLSRLNRELGSSVKPQPEGAGSDAARAA